VAERLVVPGRRDAECKHPAWQIYRDAATLCAALAKELGTSPNARLRMAPPHEDPGAEGDGILD
jgi:phage terminase small subunit